jgi:hypothetical protein
MMANASMTISSIVIIAGIEALPDKTKSIKLQKRTQRIKTARYTIHDDFTSFIFFLL